jgi:hypothetical protein
MFHFLFDHFQWLSTFCMLMVKIILLLYKERMGRKPCLFMCYGEQDLHQAMDGGRSCNIEKKFV